MINENISWSFGKDVDTEKVGEQIAYDFIDEQRQRMEKHRAASDVTAFAGMVLDVGEAIQYPMMVITRLLKKRRVIDDMDVTSHWYEVLDLASSIEQTFVETLKEERIKLRKELRRKIVALKRKNEAKGT